ncbi:unnamed protein product [Ixodes pacificus]
MKWKRIRSGLVEGVPHDYDRGTTDPGVDENDVALCAPGVRQPLRSRHHHRHRHHHHPCLKARPRTTRASHERSQERNRAQPTRRRRSRSVHVRSGLRRRCPNPSATNWRADAPGVSASLRAGRAAPAAL